MVRCLRFYIFNCANRKDHNFIWQNKHIKTWYSNYYCYT